MAVSGNGASIEFEEKSECVNGLGQKCTLILKMRLPANSNKTKFINIRMISLNNSLILSKPKIEYGPNYNIDQNHYPFVHLYSDYKDSRVNTFT